MIVLVQTSVVYLILCTGSQMVGTNNSNVQLFEYESLCCKCPNCHFDITLLCHLNCS